MNTVPPFSFYSEMTDEEMFALEKMIDLHGLGCVVSMLSTIAGFKSQHIRESWQDEGLAKRWDKASNVLAKVGYVKGMKA